MFLLCQLIIVGHIIIDVFEMHEEYHQADDPLSHNQAASPQQAGDQCEAYRSQIIISEENTSQILTVILEPDQSMWFRGDVIASNRAHTSKEARGYENFDIDRFLHLFKMKWNLPSKLSNSGPDMAYFCLQRRGGGGKILYLDHQIYKEEFVVNLSKLLTINCDPLNIEPKPVPQLPNLSKMNIKQSVNVPPLCIALQSNPGNLIYEKSLGPAEKLYIGNSQVIAMSHRIQIKKSQNQIVLTGPGFVFLQASSSLNQSTMQVQGQMQVNALLGILVMIIFTLMMIIGYLD